ncbi:hypothetical protein IJS18_01095 [Candidatus Saccharibacteria bacterium]|nr:hypothetical protein [Candidatus Saccharibacteria bacterium]MBR0431641.1 hypothetical protein [Candidatus Saccharibacteria bacterium]
MDKGSGTKKKILTIVLSFLILLIIGLAVGIVVMKLNSGPAKIDDLPNDQLVSKMLSDIRRLDVDESMDYINYRLTQYQDEEIQFELKMMKVNVYLNYDMPAEAITAAGDITEDALTPQQKMRYYHVLYQGYTKTGDEEKSIEYRDKYFTMYNIIYGESKTE